MAERRTLPLSALDDDALGRALEDLGGAIIWPDAAGLDQAVSARLRAGKGSRASGGERPRLRVLGGGRSVRRSLLLAAALALLIAGVALGVGFALRGWRVVFVDALPSVSPTPSSSSVDAGLRFVLGDPVPVAGLARRVPFPLRLPTDPNLPPPDLAFVRVRDGSQQASVVWRSVSGIPAASTTGVSLLLTQHAGLVHHEWIKKLVTGDGSVRYLEFDGRDAFWIETLHVLEYRRPDGTPAEDSTRLVERVLVWEEDGVLLRLETGGDLDDALEVARTIRRVQ